MLPQSMKIMEDFQVRKSKKQKEAFRVWLCGELEAAGCAPKVEGGFAAKNVVAGDPDTAKVIFSAHYDTCAVLPIPNFITPRNMFFYICYQLLLVIPLFLVVAVVEGILLALTVELHSPVLLPLMDHRRPGQPAHRQRQHQRRDYSVGNGVGHAGGRPGRGLLRLL